ncbi:cobalt-precorrin-5B (C(1))-methyltransferase CbiD [Sulfurimonas sp. ST-27]|uniref:cobalt-precorrin-5B (C(1))-methyltransferase CbiD n=1 Tax=Sulfurimonas sp. ST-27 TaxID=3400152 RepID=UPI003AB61C45
MSEKLKSGYTTGTHATAVFLATLYEYFGKLPMQKLSVVLPQGAEALIDVGQKERLCYVSVKGDNDDIDVTKGCEISCKLLKQKPQKIKEQTPSLLKIKNTKVYVYAGEGIGVVTKKGLKISPPHPAINPVPLTMMLENAQSIVKESKEVLYAVFSVKDGEHIAKDTANAKVGVVGGISILGTRGIVKPVSSSAYIDSVTAEIDVAAAESQEEIIFTLGNSAHDFAKKYYNESSIIEIGNFVYDASSRLKKHRIKKLIFITSVAKMCKVAQGFKNTHNKYGSIDFDEVKIWLNSELNFELGNEEFVTLKGVLQTLPDEYKEPFIKLLGYKSALRLKEWFLELGLHVHEVETITLPNEIKERLKW